MNRLTRPESAIYGITPCGRTSCSCVPGQTLITYRPFRNSDPPRLAAIWRARLNVQGLLQPMTGSILDQIVFAKPYFDRHGLIVAEDNGQVVGFAHAAFGPNESESDLSTELGVICLVMVAPRADRDEIGNELVRRCEQYLRERGSKILYAGCIRPLTPFYWGLYGGSEMPGVLDSDAESQQLFARNGYQEIDRVVILRRELSSFRPIVDRHQLQVRRTTKLVRSLEPRAKTWWEGCTQGLLSRTKFELEQAGKVVASAMYWDLEPFASSWGVRAHGLIDVDVAADHRRQGLATFLLGESFRELFQQGITLIEAQTMRQNAAAHALYKKLGFMEVGQGAIMRKA